MKTPTNMGVKFHDNYHEYVEKHCLVHGFLFFNRNNKSKLKKPNSVYWNQNNKQQTTDI